MTKTTSGTRRHPSTQRRIFTDSDRLRARQPKAEDRALSLAIVCGAGLGVLSLIGYLFTAA